MPQMAPMSWLILYFFFTMLYMLSIIMNYYSFLYPKSYTYSIFNKILITWKW